MTLGRIKWIVIAVLAIATVVLFHTVGELSDEVKRQTNNVKSLNDEICYYQFRDSAQCAEITALRLTKNELLQLRNNDATTIKQLGIKTKDVETIIKTETIVRDTVIFVLRDSCLSYQDRWASIEACLNTGEMSYQYSDSVLTCVYVKYNKRFLWWRWRPEYRTVVVNFNPHATVNYSESIIME